MLDGILGRGFAAKCKSLIKLIKSRIDVIRRKRKATEKFLRKDVADLLASGLDINAYGRLDGLLAELTLSSCYDFVEESCDYVLKHVPVLQKISGCPEECREVVSSLMFAAATFSDLPELRDLRQLFQDRYGNSLDCYLNKEFASNCNSKSFPLEKKVHLMQEIASEFSIQWDAEAFQQRTSKPTAFAQDHNACSSNHVADYNKPSHGNDATRKGVDDCDLQSRFKPPRNGFKPINDFDEAILKAYSHDDSMSERQEVAAKKNDIHKHGGRPDTVNSERKVREDKKHKVKSHYNHVIPPPYVKTYSKQKHNKGVADAVSSHVDGDGIPKYPSVHNKPNEGAASEKIHFGLDNFEQERPASRHARGSTRSHEKELSIHEDASEIPLPKPKSLSQKHSKSRSSHSDPFFEETGDVTRRSRSSRRREESRHGLQILFDDEQCLNAEEDRIVDKLPIHYSKKPVILVPEKTRRKSRSCHAHQMDSSAGEYLKDKSKVGIDETPEMFVPPRSVSLPHQQTEPAVEVNKVFTRAASFQPDASKIPRYVHPKLPDYDDLAARFAALRGR